jgi:hypothetical protein
MNFSKSFLITATLLLSQIISSIGYTKEPHFIIYQMQGQGTSPEEQLLKNQMTRSLEKGAKLAFEQLGLSYEIASPIKTPSPDRYKVVVEINGKQEVLEIKRKKDSTVDLTPKELKTKILSQLPKDSEILNIYKEYNVESILDSTKEKLKSQLVLDNRARDEYYIFVADSNIFSDLYSNFMFWTCEGKVCIISQEVILMHTFTERKDIAWASEQTAKLLTSLVLQRLGVENTNIEGCLTAPIYNAETLFNSNLELNSSVKTQLKSTLGRELITPKSRQKILREGTQALTQTSYEKSMGAFVKTALENAKNNNPAMLATLVYGGMGDGIPKETNELFELIKKDGELLKALIPIIDNLDTSKDVKVMGYDSSTSTSGQIEVTRILYAVPQKDQDPAGVIMEILRYSNNLHLIRGASEALDPTGFKRKPEDPEIPSQLD